MIVLCDVCVLVFFVVSGVASPEFSKFAGNIINLGIKTRGSSPSLPAKRFFLGGRPTFSKCKKHSKIKQTPNKERPFF